MAADIKDVDFNRMGDDEPYGSDVVPHDDIVLQEHENARPPIQGASGSSFQWLFYVIFDLLFSLVPCPFLISFVTKFFALLCTTNLDL